MSLRMQIYNELVNKHSGIRERYMEVHCKQTPFSKINSYFVSCIIAELIVELPFSLSSGDLSYFAFSMHFKIIIFV